MKDKEEMARLAGMEYALRQIKEKGIEAFEQEMRWRNQTGFTQPISQKQLNDASKTIKATTLQSVLCMTLLTLHDEFDFGPKRCKRFRDRFSLKTDCLLEDYVSWKDYQKILKDEVGIDLRIGDE